MLNEALANEDVLTNELHKRVSTFVEKTAGILLPDHKRSLIESRLRKRQRFCKLASLSEYISFALNDIGESQNLIDALTTNKTDFFREPKHYDILIEFLHQNSHIMRQPIKVWSAGCSSGEEPYTLSMLFNENLNTQFSILATDISDSMLSKAKEAIYPHHDVSPIDMNLRRKYLLLSKDKQRIKIAKNARIPVVFQKFNLVTDSFEEKKNFDFIFCRNVMIYFSQKQRSTLIEQFSRSLKIGGLFFIGHSETIQGATTRLQQIAPTVYQRVV